MTDRLAEEFVIGGLWETAPIYAERDGTKRAGTHLGFDEDGDATFTAGHIIRLSYPGGPEWRLSLRLPGPLGLGAEGLRRRVRDRMAGGLEHAEHLPEWFWPALGYASVDHEGNPWLSRYLAMTDALAKSHGARVGPGAPVYGWQRVDALGLWELSSPHSERVAIYENDITDPMAALEAAYRETR